MSPIKEANADRYPDNWKQIRARIQKRANNCCEFCGVKNYALGGRTKDGNFHPVYFSPESTNGKVPTPGEIWWCGAGGCEHLLRLIRIVCTTAHLDHVPEHCDDANLRFLCQRCHLAYDQKHHAETAYQTRREGKALDMFDESEVA